MAAVDHDIGCDLVFEQLLLTEGNANRVIVGFAVAATKNHVAVLVAFGSNNGHLAALVDTEKTVRAGNRLQRIDGYGQATIGAIFETDRRGQAGGHFTVGLGFGGACANGRPADQVLHVLRCDGVQRFSGGRQAFFGQVQQQLATDVQTVFDTEGVIQERVVDQTFPAHGGARFFEIHTHDDIQGVSQLIGQRL